MSIAKQPPVSQKVKVQHQLLAALLAFRDGEVEAAQLKEAFERFLDKPGCSLDQVLVEMDALSETDRQSYCEKSRLIGAVLAGNPSGATSAKIAEGLSTFSRVSAEPPQHDGHHLKDGEIYGELERRSRRDIYSRFYRLDDRVRERTGGRVGLVPLCILAAALIGLTPFLLISREPAKATPGQPKASLPAPESNLELPRSAARNAESRGSSGDTQKRASQTVPGSEPRGVQSVGLPRPPLQSGSLGRVIQHIDEGQIQAAIDQLVELESTHAYSPVERTRIDQLTIAALLKSKDSASRMAAWRRMALPHYHQYRDLLWNLQFTHWLLDSSEQERVIVLEEIAGWREADTATLVTWLSCRHGDYKASLDMLELSTPSKSEEVARTFFLAVAYIFSGQRAQALAQLDVVDTALAKTRSSATTVNPEGWLIESSLSAIEASADLLRKKVSALQQRN